MRRIRKSPMNRLMRVNVETSSYYALPRFLCEVERVLRPGGFLLYADVPYGRGPPW
ncbi:MAG: class SAM-dependent methyltransferase [Mycobacterium sp.]|jgi:hypothetical protein|nr:class SAM-dependent methyltransferase [Mycobacterium sp.]